MIRIKEAIIVEGKYDKVKLSSLIDGLILETRGFGIFKDKRQMELIRKLADSRGIIVLTDSDAAGFVIRGHLNSSVDNSKIKHAYIPDVFGKEKRKEKSSKEGKLGVEGVDAALILEALTRAGATILGKEAASETLLEIPDAKIIKADLFDWGLSGGAGSKERRRMLLDYLKLPEHLAPNSLVKVLNSMLTREDCENLIAKLFSEKDEEKERNF